ncbi:hypothetical protein C6501_07740 [Candidatus Poribacteria bacterium]|nr:MAG: hypothetical protein C6501_07740 [Candidatus Poribacteria bacterium]
MRKPRKALDLILTALLPVAVLSIGFFTFSLKAGLTPGLETAYPTAAGPYYRYDPDNPNPEDMYFGPEINNTTLNGGDWNQGFEITYTNENAYISVSSKPGTVNWSRNQVWNFSTNHDAPPWGTTYAYIYLNRDIKWDYISNGVNTDVGYPWAGYEIHESGEGSLIVTGEAEVTGYRKHTENDGTKYICPMYYKIGTWVYRPDGPTYLYLRFAKEVDDEFGDPEFHPDTPDTLSRRVIDGNLEGTWFDCIELN